jgi:hypothetical protein
MMLAHPARPGRSLPLAIALMALACTAARAGGDPPRDPLPTFVTHVSVSRPDCDTCPPRACPDEAVKVTVSGVVGPCEHFLGLHEVPSFAYFPDFPALQADFLVDTCGAACPDLAQNFSASVLLPPATAGLHAFLLRSAVRTCPDTTVLADSMTSFVDYNVEPGCPNPVPVDSLVRTFVKLAVVPEHPCAGDTVSVLLVENGCPPCVHLVSFDRQRAGPDTFAGVVDWAPLCVELRCVSDTLSVSMGVLPQGSFRFSARITVRVLGTANPDSAIAFSVPFEFQVAPPCSTQTRPCVVREMESVVPPNQCALTIAPGDSGDVPLLYSSDLPMAGVQGVIHVPAPFRITGLRVASHLPGVHLSFQRVKDSPYELRWLVFTDPGVTLAPGVRQHLLDATITVDPMLPRVFSQLMTSTITLASDTDGQALPLCNRLTLAVVAIRLCVATASDGLCDVNHDGRLDVRDLVRMVKCLGLGAPVDVDTSACVDCDSSGVFDLSDVFCCASDILRGPFVPRDSVHTDAAVSVTFDPIEGLGSGDLLVRVRVRGARALGAAMLRFDYPGAGWRASLPLRAQTAPRLVDADWYPIIDVSQPGRIDVGGIRLGDTGADEFVFDVVMTAVAIPFHQPTPQGRLDLIAADLAARDGSVVTPMGALPTIVLEPGATSGGTTVELSAARPNPFNGSTTFAIRLPASAPVDLAVHDIAGRRIATLAHAVYGAGEHSFRWDGAGAHDGLYFVRLTVNGQVLSTRVAMLRDSR